MTAISTQGFSSMTMDPSATGNVVCMISDGGQWCRIVRGNGGLIAEVYNARNEFVRASEKDALKIFRRFAERSLVRPNDLVVAWTGVAWPDEADWYFKVARYQSGPTDTSISHWVKELNGCTYGTLVYEPYLFGRHERVWAKVEARRWELALYVQRLKSGSRVLLLENGETDPAKLKPMMVPLIKHRDDPELDRFPDII